MLLTVQCRLPVRQMSAAKPWFNQALSLNARTQAKDREIGTVSDSSRPAPKASTDGDRANRDDSPIFVGAAYPELSLSSRHSSLIRITLV